MDISSECHALTFSIWLGQGVIWSGHSTLFVSMFWPGMVLNQGQLSIVVFDWESYLGSLFSFWSLWVVVFVCAYSRTELHGRFLFYYCFVGDVCKIK